MRPKIIPLSPIFPDRPKVFFIHDLTGSVAVYRQFAEKVERCNIYGVNQPDFNSKEKVWDIQEVARFYSDEIIRQHPIGDLNHYNLVGYSLGGVLGMEVVRNLKEKGAKIGFVALIDTPPLSLLNTLAIEKYIDLLNNLAKNIFNLDSWKSDFFTDDFLEDRISLTHYFISQCEIALDNETDAKKKNQKCALFRKIAHNLLMELTSHHSNCLNINLRKVFVFSTKKTASDFQVSDDLGWREFFEYKFDHESAVSLLPDSCGHFDIFRNEKFFSSINIFLREQSAKIKFTEFSNLMLQSIGLLSEEERLPLLEKFFRKAEKAINHKSNCPHSALWLSHRKIQMVDSRISPPKIYGKSV